MLLGTAKVSMSKDISFGLEAGRTSVTDRQTSVTSAC